MTEQVESVQLEVMAPSAIEAIERANIDLQISTAKRFPRVPSVVKKKMLELACLDEDTAASCSYRLVRQGKKIEGPSIRMAEIAAGCFGNMRWGARVIANDGKKITAQGFCHDLESNTMATVEVGRRITNREGQTYSEDMQVVTGNAACAIASRNAVFKVVPFALVKPILARAKEVAVGTAETLKERRGAVMKEFKELGAKEKRVFAAVGVKGIEDIGLEQLGDLIPILNALRDGDQTVDEAFPPEQTAEPVKFGDPVDAPPGAVGAEGMGGHGLGPTGPKPAKQKAEKPAPPPRATPLETVQRLMASAKIEEGPLLAFLFGKMKIEQGDKLDTLPDVKLAEIADNFVEIVEEMQKA